MLFRGLCLLLLLSTLAIAPAALGLQAVPSATPSSGPAPLQVTLTPNQAGGSFYEWQFEYVAGTPFAPDYSSESGESVTYTYTSPGTYLARVRVWDAITGIPTEQDVSITVFPPPVPPVVGLTFTAPPIAVDDVVTFDATASASPGGSITNYYWDLNGDGVTDTSSPGGPTATTAFTYPTIGPHRVTVTAEDTFGLASTVEVEVRVSRAPFTTLTILDPLLGATNQSVDFSASATPVSPWMIDLYNWDFGDGASGGTPGGPSSATSHTYAVAGSYTVGVTAVDEAGHSGARTGPVEVRDPPAILTTQDLTDDFEGTFIAQAVTVPGATITSYDWDFGDGTPLQVEPGGLSSTVTHLYPPAPNTYTVTVTAHDDLGESQVDSFLFISDFKPPEDAMSVFIPPPISLNLQVEGGSSAITRVGHVVTFTAEVDTDPPQAAPPPGTTPLPVFGQLLWDFDGDRIRDRDDDLHPGTPTTVTVLHQFQRPGVFTIAARALLIGTGAESSGTVTVTVRPPTPPLECWFAVPQDGATVWGDSVTLTARTGPAGLTDRVVFKYRPAGSGAPWTTIGTVVPPPVSSLSVAWDTTSLAVGDYELLAEGHEMGGAVALSTDIRPITVTVSPTNPDQVAGAGGPTGGQFKEETVDPNGPTRTEISRDTTLNFPGYAFGLRTRIRIERPTSNPHPLEARLQDINFIPGTFRRLSLVGTGVGLEKPSRITLYDLNPAGVLDGLNVDPSQLKIYQFDGTSRKWIPLFEQLIQPKEDLIHATMVAMGDVGIAAPRKSRARSTKSDGCGFSGGEVFLILALAALFARRRRRASA